MHARARTKPRDGIRAHEQSAGRPVVCCLLCESCPGAVWPGIFLGYQMSLPRKDVRLKLNHDVHAAVVAIADALGLEPAAWVEQVIVDIVKKRVHEANLLIDSLKSSGSMGTFGDEAGT